MAVIGAGTMGTGIVYVFAAAGWATTVVEPDPIRAERCREELAAAVADGVRRRRLDGAEGFTMQPLDAALRLPEKQFTLFFDDVRVESGGLIGEEGSGLRQVFAGLNPERIAASCVANGIARYALGVGAAYARDRTVWSAPIGSHQGWPTRWPGPTSSCSSRG